MKIPEYDALQEGEEVLFNPGYFLFSFIGVIRKDKQGRNGVWVNFCGDGQCLFVPSDGRKKTFCKCVWKYENDKEKA